jgi:hypothetical protein
MDFCEGSELRRSSVDVALTVQRVDNSPRSDCFTNPWTFVTPSGLTKNNYVGDAINTTRLFMAHKGPKVHKNPLHPFAR